MPEPFAQISQADIDALGRKLDEHARFTRRELKDSVKVASKIWLRKAISATPMAAKFTRWVWAKIDGILQGIRLPHPEYDHGTVDQVSTPGRAYAKSGWVRGLLALGIFSGRKHGQGPGSVSIRLNAPEPVIEITNDVPYIESLDRGGPMPALPQHPSGHTNNKPRHILAKATRRTTKELERRMLRTAKRMAAKWR